MTSSNGHSALSGARVLVTGGCGAIGTRICSLLVRLGARPRVLDNLRAYPFDYRARFAAVDPALAEVEVVVGDVTDENVVDAALQGASRVVHAAAFADVGASIRFPDEDFRSNVLGTQRLLSAAIRHDVARLVFVSSASVYGAGKRGANGRPFRESDPPRPVSTYANSKLWGEHQVRLYSELYGLPSVTLRLFSAYGAPQVPKEGSHSWCVAFFAMRALRGLPMEVYGDGRQVRDFVHVDDIARAVALALVAPEPGHGLFNVGTGRPTEVRDVARMVEERVGGGGIVHAPGRCGDPAGGHADTSLACEVLGFQAGIDLASGIDGYVKWVVANQDLIPGWLLAPV